jgi:hypothetical protein
VENIFWPAGKAPWGRYEVFVTYFANNGASDPTNFLCGWIVRGVKTQVRGAISAGNAKRKVGEFVLAPPPFNWRDPLTAALWMSLLTIGFSLSLVMGQNSYLGKSLLSPGQAVRVILGAAAAGIVAGGVADLLFEALTRSESLASVGRLVGWVFLGAVVGPGMSYFVPNLPRFRAAIAGAAGGLVGGLAFECLVHALGNVPARFAGAAILGFCIGLMVALVEVICREAWLEVHYGPKETKNFSLGKQAVTIGSGPQCTVYIAQAPSLALRYMLENGRVRCWHGENDRPLTVFPGHEESVGKVRVVVQAFTAAKSRLEKREESR